MDFFAVHEHWFVFLACLALFPRLTMLLTGVCFMGWSYPVWFWIGWLLTPRFVAAILGTWFYFHTNPVLCIFAWLIALGVSGGEKSYINSRRS